MSKFNQPLPSDNEAWEALHEHREKHEAPQGESSGPKFTAGGESGHNLRLVG